MRAQTKVQLAKLGVELWIVAGNTVVALGYADSTALTVLLAVGAVGVLFWRAVEDTR